MPNAPAMKAGAQAAAVLPNQHSQRTARPDATATCPGSFLTPFQQAVIEFVVEHGAQPPSTAAVLTAHDRRALHAIEHGDRLAHRQAAVDHFYQWVGDRLVRR